jgi:fructokinase
LAAIGTASAVAVNSFQFDDARQTDALVAALRQATGLVIIDPNPRPRLINDMAAYRGGAEKAMAHSALVKISDEDADLLYAADRKAAVTRLFNLGVAAVLHTHGAEGASIHTKSGTSVSAGAAPRTKPIIDTMGAGDATLATVIGFILRQGMPANAGAWRDCLKEAMQVAGATCAHAGGALILPEGLSLQSRANP